MLSDYLICADCLAELAKLPTESVRMVFADPPFNVGKAYRDNPDRDDREAYYSWCGEWIKECFRVLTVDGTFYLMTITKHLERKMPLMAEHGLFINLVTWRNVASASSKRTFWNEYQPILVYGKSDHYIFNTYAQRTTHRLNRWGKMTTEPQGQMQDRWEDIQFVWAGSNTHPEAIMLPGTNRKAHPCQMPIALPYRAMLFSSNEGDLVLDPFVGIGTTAVAAIRAKRHYLGIDISEAYIELAERRIAEELNELRLF